MSHHIRGRRPDPAGHRPRSLHHFDFYRTLDLPAVEGVDWEGSLGGGLAHRRSSPRPRPPVTPPPWLPADLCVVEWPHPALPLPDRLVRVHLALGGTEAGQAADAAGEEDASPRTAHVEVVGGARSHVASGLTDPLVWRQWGLHTTAATAPLHPEATGTA